MNFGHRIFIVGDDNSISKIAQRSFDEFFRRNEPTLLRFSGCEINVAIVIYSLENRKPKQIVHIDYMRIKVATNGTLDQTQHQDIMRIAFNRMDRALGFSPQPRYTGSVIDASEKFDEKRWSRHLPKLPGPAHKRILEALFGSQKI